MSDEELRMNAYYYSFAPTGERAIDVVLSAVACAGKAYHHTEDWREATEPYERAHRGPTPCAWIENAAADAAKEAADLRAQLSLAKERIEKLEVAVRQVEAEIRVVGDYVSIGSKRRLEASLERARAAMANPPPVESGSAAPATTTTNSV